MLPGRMCTVAYYLADEGAGADADAALTLANHRRTDARPHRRTEMGLTEGGGKPIIRYH